MGCTGSLLTKRVHVHAYATTPARPDAMCMHTLKVIGSMHPRPSISGTASVSACHSHMHMSFTHAYAFPANCSTALPHPCLRFASSSPCSACVPLVEQGRYTCVHHPCQMHYLLSACSALLAGGCCWARNREGSSSRSRAHWRCRPTATAYAAVAVEEAPQAVQAALSGALAPRPGPGQAMHKRQHLRRRRMARTLALLGRERIGQSIPQARHSLFANVESRNVIMLLLQQHERGSGAQTGSTDPPRCQVTLLWFLFTERSLSRLKPQCY